MRSVAGTEPVKGRLRNRKISCPHRYKNGFSTSLLKRTKNANVIAKRRKQHL